jgi:osmotically-inducible protein OsmY
MKTTRLLAIIMAAVFAAGCTGMSNSSQPSKSSQTSATTATDDGSISTQAKNALQADPELKAFKIDVSTSAGVVKIKGDIKSFVLRRKAEELIKAVPGVKSVDNQLLITG